MASERERGFYWVKFGIATAWEIAKWTGRHWLVTGAVGHHSDDYWHAIGERIPDHE